MNDKSFFCFVKRYWQILVLVGGLISGWTLLKTTTNFLDIRLAKVETEQKDQEKTISAMGQDIREIKTKTDMILKLLEQRMK